MTILKQELSGIITLKMAVKEADGVLLKDAKVKISGDMEVEAVDAANDDVLGVLLVPNTEAGGDATVITKFKRVSDETTGAAYSAGAYLGVTSAGKFVKASAARATATITIVDYSLVDAGDTVVVNGVTLTAGGTDFTAATSNTATALSLATAINNKVPGVKASYAAGVVTVECLEAGVVGNAFTLTTTADVGEMTVSGATFTGGREFTPVAQALEASTGADQTKSIGWF